MGLVVGRQKKGHRKATDMSHLTLSCNQFELGGYMKIILCQLHQIAEKYISMFYEYIPFLKISAHHCIGARLINVLNIQWLCKNLPHFRLQERWQNFDSSAFHILNGLITYSMDWCKTLTLF